jgi:hypothetical protein
MLAVTMKAPYFSGSFNPSAPRCASDPNFAPATSYDQVKAQAARILSRLKNEDDPMPPADEGGPWPQEWITLFERWITEGFPA